VKNEGNVTFAEAGLRSGSESPRLHGYPRPSQGSIWGTSGSSPRRFSEDTVSSSRKANDGLFYLIILHQTGKIQALQLVLFERLRNTKPGTLSEELDGGSGV
jgi:hypothetical protein